MNGLDWILLGIAFFTLARGIARGAVAQVFGVAAVLGGFVFAAHHYNGFALEISHYFPRFTGSEALSFVLLFLMTWMCVGLVGFLLSSMLHHAGLGPLDRVMGGLIGLIKAAILAVVLVSILTFFMPPKTPFLFESRLTPYLQEAAHFVVKTAPATVQELFEKRREELKDYLTNPEASAGPSQRQEAGTPRGSKSEARRK